MHVTNRKTAPGSTGRGANPDPDPNPNANIANPNPNPDSTGRGLARLRSFQWGVAAVSSERTDVSRGSYP